MAFASTTQNKNTAIKRRKKNRLYLGIFLIVLLVAILFAVSVVVSRMDQFQIKDVVISGNTVTDGTLIEDVVRSGMKDTYFWMFPKSNSFLFPEKAITSEMLSEFARVERVELVRTNLSTLAVNITERKPKALWCEGLKPFLTGTSIADCYFLDASGLIFSRAPDFSRNVFVRYLGEISATTTIGGVYGDGHFPEYDFFVQSLVAEHLPVTDLIVHKDGNRELYLSSGVKILFDNRQDLSVVLTNIKLIIEKDELSLLSVTPRFEYVDLRYGNKVFYKNRQN
ncbi:MAG: hypothetical protein RLZZ347_88 [Candidatus Parcubacteria bacterium]|jgi:cell division septal protein FtsQ